MRKTPDGKIHGIGDPKELIARMVARGLMRHAVPLSEEQIEAAAQAKRQEGRPKSHRRAS